MSRDGSSGMLILIGIALLLVCESRYNSTPEGKMDIQLRRIRTHVREVEKKHGESPELQADSPKDDLYEDER